MRILLFAVLLAIGLLSVAQRAHAFDLPQYDSASFFKTTSALVGGSEFVVSGCMMRERDAQIQIKRVLSFGVIDDAALRQCDAMSRVSAGGSYQGFVGCLILNITQQILDGKVAITKVTPKAP